MKNKLFILYSSILIILACLLPLYAAGAYAPKAYAAEVSFQERQLTICAGEKYQLKAKHLAGKKNIKWKSSRPKTASVSSKGVIYGKRAGSTKITVTCQEGRGVHAKKSRASCRVKVGNYIKSMEVSPQDAMVMEVGETGQIQTAIYPAKAKKNKVFYESSNRAVASVTAKGTITAIQPGKTIIKITSEGKTVKKEKLYAVIQVFVKDDTGAITLNPGTQTTQNPPDTSGSQDDKKPAEEDGDAAKALSGKELQVCIDALPKADKDVLVPGVILAKESNGELYTLYFINKEYEGKMALLLGKYSFSLDTTPVRALKMLETMGYTGKNGSKTLYVERKRLPDSTVFEEWWKVTELASGITYELKGMTEDTIYFNKNGYGLVVVKGDTTDVVKIQ